MFHGAVESKIRAFNQFATFVDQNIDTLRQSDVLMYCTGGVRCEKAAAYLRSRGCPAVSQLRGGIHRYMEAFADDQTSQWRGLCTVFDERIAVGCSSSGKSLGKCVMCATECHVPNTNRRCIECRCLVLYCQSCYCEHAVGHCTPTTIQRRGVRRGRRRDGKVTFPPVNHTN